MAAKFPRTLTELSREADDFGLSTEQYDELRDRFYERFASSSTPESREIELRKNFEKEVRPRIREELLPIVRAEVEKEMRPRLLAQVKDEARKEAFEQASKEALVAARKELLGKAPSDAERVAFTRYFRGMEVECLAYADVAYAEAAAEKRKFKIRRLMFGVPFFMILVGALPILSALHFFGWPYDSFRFIAAGLGMLVLAIVLGYWNLELGDRLWRRYEHLSSASKGYHSLAQRARQNMLQGRIVSSLSELVESTNSFRGEWERQNGNYVAHGDDVDRARQKVQHRALTSIVDLDEEDPRHDPTRDYHNAV